MSTSKRGNFSNILEKVGTFCNSSAPSEVTKHAENVINEQSGLIDEYHAQLRTYIEKNQALTRQVEYLKKEEGPKNYRLNRSSEKASRKSNTSALKIQENSFDQGNSSQ